MPVGVTRSEGGHFAGRGAGRSLFPFSITAGIEKGDKNRWVLSWPLSERKLERYEIAHDVLMLMGRYRNIWPFEHARVRLRKCAPEDDDYMNASYVQPLGTTKRYIATQGPLASTFTDFWT